MSDVHARMEALEERLGDPFDAAGGAGFAAVLTADEREEVPVGGASALDEFGILSEFVPGALGGRLERVDHLIELMRSVYRRDPSLGLGHCSSSLLGAVNVWTAGSPDQRRDTAELLLAGHKVSCAFHELAHGNDIGSVEFAATPAEGRLVLSGRKESITNLDRADAMVFLARTDPDGGPRSCSQLLVPTADLDPDRVRFLPRFRSVGMRGVRLGGIAVDSFPVAADALLGAPGTGLETANRAFQLTRIAMPAMSTAMLDTGLRVTLHHMRARRLYGRDAASIPMVRTTLANTFADLLLCEAFGAVAARSLHALPESGSAYAPAVKYLLAGVTLDAFEQLSLVMGSEFYRRDGQHGVFQKMARDIKPVGFGHIARAACLSAVLPQLPVLARRSWRDAAPAPAALFVPDAELPPLDLPGLRVTAGGKDGLVMALNAALDDDVPAALRPLIERQIRGVRALTEACAGLKPRDLSIAATVEVRDLAARYTTALAAAACVGVWRHAPGDDFLARPEWLVAALTRLEGITAGQPVDVPDDVEGALVDELLSRDDRTVSFGISARQYR
ncbi:acyl-CoA dehydrogenase [Streptomyces flavofungini]|uniref:acyl-CoA dehydrogenase n=1 Tax=Streptomyces flavofungini TaxID=68200 RepID=UPI0025B0648F|nr:acyl-CoA dehydrogenase [Streptomyces flavofungini]WJV44950.1 acyl-CoA dehydrogenase [Streptomyces flavofungini]